MKNLVGIVFATLVGLFLLLASVIAYQFSPTYLYRLVVLNVADALDYQHFHNRTIAPSSTPKAFDYGIDEAQVESLFAKRLQHSGFTTFEQWITHSQTTSLIVVQDGTILYEKYFNGFSKDSYFHSQSMAKSFISFLIGTAIDEGLITSVNEPITTYIPELLGRDRQFAQITIKHLLQMRSGLAYREHYLPGTNIHSPWHDEAVGYYHDDVRSLLLEYIQVESAPGQAFEYNNFNTSLLGLIIERVSGDTVSAYLEQALWSKIMQYDALFAVDSEDNGFEFMPSRLSARAIDYARFGQLYLDDGQWQNQQIVSPSWVNASANENTTLTPTDYPDWFSVHNCRRRFYTYHWWGHTTCHGVTEFFASGNLGQNIYIAPDIGVVIVHTGNGTEHYGDRDLWYVAEALRRLRDARSDS